MTTRRSAFWPAALMALTLTAAACGGGDDDGGAADTDTGTETETAGSGATDGTAVEGTESEDQGAQAPGQDTTPDDREVDATGTMRIAYTVGPSRWDPHKATSSFDNTSLFITYDRLIHQSPAAEAVPGLAEEWTFAEDGSYLELSLREGVTFHDGEPFDAEAVKANIERAQTVEGSAVAPELAGIDSVEVVDEFTARLMLNGPGASLPLVLSDRAGMMVSPAAFENPDLGNQPVGAGMYEVVEYRQDDMIVYEAYEDYWDPEAVGAARIEYSIMPDSNTRLNAIRTGQLDWTLLDPPQITDAESAGLTVEPTPSLSYLHLQLNRSFEPFANVDVRKALNHAINNEAIVEAVLLGYGDLNQQSFPEWYFAFDPETGTESYPYDPETARALLEGAGYGDGFEFEVIVPTIPIYNQLYEAMQPMLAEVGITMTLRGVPGAQVADLFYAQEESQAIISPWGGRPDPSQTLYLLFTPDGFSNPGDGTTDAFMELFPQTLEIGDREESLQAASAQIVEDAMDVVMYYPQTPYAYGENVVGFEQWFSGKPEFRGMGVATG
ncbi:ABC transporter substrate-binding protein [Ilumatobacter sp.]|uniref:ABC transporter substrate-binding protein n=1 Tax=Ilumatobacter sp. TaxID=1967498 RepID=UPI003B51EDF6